MGTEQVAIDNELILSLRSEVEALSDEVTELRDTNKNLRNTQRVARTVIRGLREQLTTVQEAAEQNDDAFKALCQEDIEIVEEVAPAEQGGLPQTVEAVEPLF